MPNALQPTITAPLFVWREIRDIDRLEDQRLALIERINKLPRRSHKRVELEATLRQITAEELRIAALRGNHA